MALSQGFLRGVVEGSARQLAAFQTLRTATSSRAAFSSKTEDDTAAVEREQKKIERDVEAVKEIMADPTREVTNAPTSLSRSPQQDPDGLPNAEEDFMIQRLRLGWDHVMRNTVQHPMGGVLNYEDSKDIVRAMKQDLDPHMELVLCGMPSLSGPSRAHTTAILDDQKESIMEALGIQSDAEWEAEKAQATKEFNRWRNMVRSTENHMGDLNMDDVRGAEAEAALLSAVLDEGMPAGGEYRNEAVAYKDALLRNPQMTASAKAKILQRLVAGLTLSGEELKLG